MFQILQEREQRNAALMDLVWHLPHSLNSEKIALILDIELFSPGINPDSTRFCGRVV
jgi:hypothetical protein